MSSWRALPSPRKMLEPSSRAGQMGAAWTPKAVPWGDGLGATGSAFVGPPEREDGACYGRLITSLEAGTAVWARRCI